MERIVSNMALGSNFSSGLFIAQDDRNPNNNQNYKLCSWEEIFLLSPELLSIDTTYDPRNPEIHNSDSSVAVEISSFRTRSVVKGVELIWTTESENENQGFIISRKTGTNNWIEIASFACCKNLEGQGSTSQPAVYTFTDDEVKDKCSYYYLLSEVNYHQVRTDHYHLIKEITYLSPNVPSYPNSFRLTWVYPNPFNSSVILSYDITKVLDLDINIFSLSGKLIWKYYQSNHPAGYNYRLNWNGYDLSKTEMPSGTYFLRIQAGKQVLTRKVTLLR